jgi:hypothetical protein
MSALVLDSGAVTRLARRDQDAAAIIAAFVRDRIWPPLVPSVVLVECLSGLQRNDVLTNRFLKTCEIIDEVPQHLARRYEGFLRLCRRAPVTIHRGVRLRSIWDAKRPRA